MIRTAVLATAAIAALCLAAPANAADAKVKARPGAAVVALDPPGQDCSVFYDDYRRRGFAWGAGPGSSLGFGVFEGALPRYPVNEFPNWYGECIVWGHYSATKAVRW